MKRTCVILLCQIANVGCVARTMATVEDQNTPELVRTTHPTEILWCSLG